MSVDPPDKLTKTNCFQVGSTYIHRNDSLKPLKRIGLHPCDRRGPVSHLQAQERGEQRKTLRPSHLSAVASGPDKATAPLSHRLSGRVQPVGASMADASMPILLLVFGLLFPASLSLRCPSSVSSFSASVSPGHYYTCTSERVAVLNTCPEGQIYSDKKKVIKNNLYIW